MRQVVGGSGSPVESLTGHVVVFMNSRQSLFLCVVLLFFIIGCNITQTQEAGSRGENKSNMIVSTVEPLGLTITLPEGMIRQGSADKPMFCFQDSLDTRYPKCFTLAAVESKPEDDFSDWESVDLDSGGKFYYQRKLINVGSGGPEDHLTGYVEINDRYFKVEASEQRRSEQPDATWCVPIIQTLRCEF